MSQQPGSHLSPQAYLSSNGFVNQQWARIRRNYALSGLLVLIIVGSLAGVFQNHLRNFLLGPFPVAISDLKKIGNIDDFQNYHVVLNPDSHANVGNRSGSRSGVKSLYHLLMFTDDDFMIIAETDTDYHGGPISGAITIPTTSVQNKVIAPTALQLKREKVTPTLASFIIDAKEYRSNGWIILSVAAAVTLLGLSLLTVAILHSAGVHRQRWAKKVIRNAAQPNILTDLDRDLTMPTSPTAPKGIRFGQDWIAQTSRFNCLAVKIDDIVWVHKKVVKNSVNGIPTGSTVSMVTMDRRGNTTEFPGKDKLIDIWMETLTQRIPWVITGFDDTLATAAKTAFPTFLEAVDKRKAELGKK